MDFCKIAPHSKLFSFHSLVAFLCFLNQKIEFIFVLLTNAIFISDFNSKTIQNTVWDIKAPGCQDFFNLSKILLADGTIFLNSFSHNTRIRHSYSIVNQSIIFPKLRLNPTLTTTTFSDMFFFIPCLLSINNLISSV